VGWVCAKGHCWEAAIGNRTDKDSRCPKCRRSKLEDALEEALVSLGHDPLGEQRFEDLGKRLAYDNAILLPSGLMVLFEADGEQHFRPVDFSNHRKPAEVQANYEASLKRDIAKNDYVRVSGRALLRIPWTRLADIPTLVEDFLSGGPQAGSVTYIDEGMYTAAYATAASPGHIGDDDPIWAELELA
jgi:hypothetical protein